MQGSRGRAARSGELCFDSFAKLPVSRSREGYGKLTIVDIQSYARERMGQTTLFRKDVSGVLRALCKHLVDDQNPRGSYGKLAFHQLIDLICFRFVT